MHTNKQGGIQATQACGRKCLACWPVLGMCGIYCEPRRGAKEDSYTCTRRRRRASTSNHMEQSQADPARRPQTKQKGLNKTNRNAPQDIHTHAYTYTSLRCKSQWARTTSLACISSPPRPLRQQRGRDLIGAQDWMRRRSMRPTSVVMHVPACR